MEAGGRDTCQRCDRLEVENRRLRQEVEELRRMIEELQRKNQRPHAPFSKGTPKADPKLPGRKSGPEHGLHAHRPPPSQIDETYEAPCPSSCPHCGGKVEAMGQAVQYQTEIVLTTVGRRFNIGRGRCLGCGRHVQGRHPLQTSAAYGAAASQLGADAKAMAVFLNKDMGLAHGKISRFFATFFELSLVRGASARIMLRGADRADVYDRQIALAVRRSPVVYLDETGWKVGGVLCWLWVFVTDQVTLYRIRPSRGSDVPQEILGADYSGLLGHDGWCAYDPFANAGHGQCQAHLLRRCHHLLETAKGGARRLPLTVKRLLKQGLAVRDRRKNRQISPHGLAVATGKLQARLDHLLAGRYTHPANARLVKHLARHRNQIFTYLAHPQLEATNWMAEQAIRPAVVNRKVWGGSRTWNGAYAQGVLMSCLRSSYLQALNPFRFLSQLFSSQPLPKLLFSG